MIPNFTIEESMGESTQIIYSKCESAYDDYLEGFDDLLDNTEYAFKVECEMKKSVKNGIISKLKEKIWNLIILIMTQYGRYYLSYINYMGLHLKQSEKLMKTWIHCT